MSGETDPRWIDARNQIADCLTKHASRKSDTVLQKILQEAQWRITAEAGPTQTGTRDPQQFFVRRRIVAYERIDS